MRNKRFTMLMAAVMLLGCLVPSAMAASYTADSLFSISYDENTFFLDDAAYDDENTGDDYRWLFILISNDMLFDVSMCRLEQYANLNLYSADETDQAAYVADTLDSYSDENVKLLGSLTVQQVPFYLYALEGEDGPYLMAETIVQGYGLDFLVYYNDSDLPVDDELQQAMTTLLNTFTPVR